MTISVAVAGAVAMASCAAGHYTVSSVERTRILIDSRYDRHPDAAAAEFLAPYKASVDSLMSPVMGTAACDMARQRPESPLSNLLADILVWSSAKFGEKPDFAVYNVGGIRASFPKGDVTYGDVLDVAPFENKICFCTLTGDKVTELFEQMAGWGGQGVSHGVEAVFDKDAKIVSLKINGEPVDPKREYRIATLDYVAEGNDRMLAFKSKTKVNSPAGSKNNVRELIIRYFKETSAKGGVIDADKEGRFVINK